MKTILLTRHAKSTWDNSEWTDLTRPINKRGIEDATVMSNIISSKLAVAPDTIYSSHANRALMTALIFAKQLNYLEENIIVDENIYNNGARHIKRLLETQNNSTETIMFFGHNPDITSLASYFSGSYIKHVPTCGTVVVDFDMLDWREVLNNNGTIRIFDYPKKHY